MQLKKHLTVLTLGSVALLSLGFAGCSTTTGTSTPETSTASPTSPDVAQHSMPGDQGTMPGMEHGAMNMSLGPKDEFFDLRFIDAMTPHHEGAVAMAEEALQKSKRPEIRELAQAIISAQAAEISQMKSWRTAWYPQADDTPMMYSAEMGHMMPMSTAMRDSMMMSGDLGAADEQFDLRFINAMLPHHQSALTMAQEALEKSVGEASAQQIRPETQQLATAILSSQQAEIEQMTQWKKDWYGQ